MKLSDQIRMARQNLKRQKGRTRLTMLSIVIGSFAVITVLTITFAATSAVNSYYEKTGLLYSIEVFDWSGKGIKDSLIEEVRSLDGVEAVSPTVNLYSFRTLTFGEKSVVNFSTRADLSNGATANVILAGRDLTPGDEGPVALVSRDLADALSGGVLEDLVGQQLIVTTDEYYRGPNQSRDNCDYEVGTCNPVDIPITVLGIHDSSHSVVFPLEYGLAQNVSTYYYPAGGSCADFGGSGQRCEDGFIVETNDPIGDSGYPGFRIRAASEDAVPLIVAQLASTYAMTNQLDFLAEQGDYSFAVGRESLKEILAVTTNISLALLAIGGISLLVSALGVINTMLMATLERTREIGVMRAIGASRSDITRVFTVEAALLGFLGGIWGLVFASSVILGVAIATDGFATFGFSLGIPSLVLTGILPATIVVGLTTLIGIISGVLPARRAARLNPVDSLRHE